MGEFDIIETGFDCADETINFGTRSIGYDTLYEISTIACLKSSSEEEVSIYNNYLLQLLVNSEPLFFFSKCHYRH